VDQARSHVGQSAEGLGDGRVGWLQIGRLFQEEVRFSCRLQRSLRRYSSTCSDSCT